jgi:hypothetical protein
MKLKLTLTRLKPHNRFVAAARRSGAGLHRNTHPQRLQRRALREELARFEHERHQT